MNVTALTALFATWANVDPDLKHHMALLAHTALIYESVSVLCLTLYDTDEFNDS